MSFKESQVAYDPSEILDAARREPRGRVERICAALRNHRGPLLTPEDVDRLLAEKGTTPAPATTETTQTK